MKRRGLSATCLTVRWIIGKYLKKNLRNRDFLYKVLNLSQNIEVKYDELKYLQSIVTVVLPDIVLFCQYGSQFLVLVENFD